LKEQFIAEQRKKRETLEGMLEYYWDEIGSGFYNFDRFEAELARLKSLKITDMINFFSVRVPTIYYMI